jgi:type I restriction enzyme S subunit
MARKMKDSGIEWIGEIPEGWEIRKIKNNFMIYAGATPKSEKAEYWDGGIPWITPADFKTTDKYVSYGRKSLTALGYDSCGSTLVPAGSIIFSKRAPVGSVVIAKNTLCTNQGCLACIPNDAVNSTYFYYCMSIFTEQFELVSAGTTFKEIAASTFASFLLPCPPLSQQNEIVNFLDKESSHIDSMLSKTRSSIEEYKKLKQAVITQAVTKGVRGEREMKDSGVEWIGEIPKKWNRCKLNSICTFINGDRSKNYPSSEDFQDIGIPFIGADSLNGFFVDTYSARHISPAKYASMGGLKITQGDILYTLRGSTIGKNAIANFNDGTIASSLVGIRVKSPFLASSSLLFYWLNSPNEFVQRDLCINGSTAPNLSAENVAQFFIYIPDITEQHEIADYLDAKCAEIDRLIAKKEQLVKELESYKKSLIYEVVTGKREV